MGNPFDYLDITNLSSGTYWLEAEINPANSNGVRSYVESDTSNNIARAQIPIVATSAGSPPQ
jgi:hypothetical protein